MTSVSKELRAELDARFTLDRPEVVAEQISVDGTRKWLLRLPGEFGDRPHEVECVYIPETGRGTLCVSSQVGCTLNCTLLPHRHPAAGAQPHRRRDRRPGPGRPRPARRLARRAPPTGAIVPTDGGRFVTNIVMMGMGEPLYNFEAVRDALLVVADNEGLAISKRKITLSTSGVVPNIARTGDEIGVMLAVSLHAVRDESAQRAGAAQPQISDRRIARRLPQLSRPHQRQAHHLRICDAQGRERYARRRARRWSGCSTASRRRST